MENPYPYGERELRLEPKCDRGDYSVLRLLSDCLALSPGLAWLDLERTRGIRLILGRAEFTPALRKSVLAVAETHGLKEVVN